jgi:hypothetical protein
MLLCQIPSQSAPGLFGRMPPLLEVMAVFARAELGQIGRKMVRNDLIGASLSAGHPALPPVAARPQRADPNQANGFKRIIRRSS